jgi:light-regulated signal transduction histidine kinase (bacteriophytochrome)
MLATARIGGGWRKRMTPETLVETIGNVPPTIQPRGWILACDGQAAHVVDHSTNIHLLFPPRPVGFFGVALRDLVGSATAHTLRNALSRAGAARRPALLPRLPIAGLAGLYDFAIHATGHLTIIEIEVAGPPEPFALDRVRTLVDRMVMARGPDRLIAMATRLLQAMLQWDCVTGLRLDSEGVHVLAQQKRLEWPAAEEGAVLCADFPVDERAGLGAARLRLVADLAAAPVGMAGDKTPDLGATYLRAATADELARGRAAGFAALLSLPILVEGALWGVLLAHHRAARSLTIDERAVFELFGDYLSLATQAALAREAADEFRRRHAL